jgi:hypothetical protein
MQFDWVSWWLCNRLHLLLAIDPSYAYSVTYALFGRCCDGHGEFE